MNFWQIPLAYTYPQVVFFGFFVILMFFLLIGVFWFGIWLTKKNKEGCLSPYSKKPLRRASTLSYYSTEHVLRYLRSYHQYDNRMIDLNQAAICRETGRLFPDCITWYDTIDVDWTFLQKRYPGRYVSWGSLTLEQQNAIRDIHGNIDDFQTDFSSSQSSPRDVELEYALAKPGPLYVDVETNVLLGWKLVPQTDLEVLIVQKPKKPSLYTPSETGSMT